MSYATLAELRTYQDIESSTDNDLLQDLLDAATQAIDDYTHRTFAVSSDTTRYFDAVGDHIVGGRLDLDTDLAAVTTVTNGDTVVVSSSEYTTTPRNETPYYAIRLLSQSSKIWTYTNEYMDAIEIVGRWGYSTDTNTPESIKQACKRLAAFYYKQRDAALFDVTAIEGGTVIKPQGLPGDVGRLIEPFRLKI